MQLKVANHLTLALVLSALSSYIYVAFEWLFFVTKPSLLNILSGFDQFLVLLVAPLPLAIVALFLSCIICIPLYLLIEKLTSRRIWCVLLLVPISLLSATEFILVDNFTYTMIGVGVSTFTGYERIFYLVVFLYLFFVNYRLLVGCMDIGSWVHRNSKRFVIASSALMLLSSFTLLVFADKPSRTVPLISSEELNIERKNLPNILILSTDGLNNDSMSAYGYERPTTPFIESLLDESLVFENHFTNSAFTTSSVGSLLGAKHPTKTRVIYRPDVFTGIHSVEHLPGLLRQLGYIGADESVRHFVDAHDLNMRESFHYANGRELSNEGLRLPEIYTRGFPVAALFVESLYSRVSSRLLHLLGVSRMYNPFLALTQPDVTAWQTTDNQRIQRIKKFILETDKPFFAHVHLLNTHGDFFPAANTHFTGEREQRQPWDRDFYDNAVLGYDDFTREVVEFLKSEGKFENTIIVLNSDHGYKWRISRPIPLIIRFPNADYAGVIRTNSQRLDIAPTLVEYIGLTVPEWMDGSSLLNLKRSAQDPIYIVSRQSSVQGDEWRVVQNPRPPFYTLGKLFSVYCNWVFTLDLNSKEFKSHKSRGHTAECERDQFPQDRIIRESMISYLEQQGYETSRLK